MGTINQDQCIPLNLRFSHLHLSKADSSSVKPIGEFPSTFSFRSIFDAVQPDAAFIQDMTQGLADTSWERQEASAWVSDEEDSGYIEAHLQTARHLSSTKLVPVHDSIPISSPASTDVSKVQNSPLASSNSQAPVLSSSDINDSDSPNIELFELLKSAQLEIWIDKVLEQDIDLGCIIDLTDNDLIGLGMSKIGTRRKFQRIVRQWAQQKSAVPAMNS